MNSEPKTQSVWTRLRKTPDAATLEELYHQTSARVWTICFRILNHEDDARDAFQETYTRLLREARSAPANADLATIEPHAYAARLAALESDNLRKRRARHQHREVPMQLPEDSPAPQLNAAEALLLEEIRRLVRKEAGNLSDDLRVPLQLYYFDGLSQREIAQTLNVSLGTVNTRIKRAFQTLEPRFKRLGLQEPEKLFAGMLPFAALLIPPADLSAQTVCQTAAAGSVASGGAVAALSTTGVGVKVATLAGIVLSVVVLVLSLNTMRATPKQTATLIKSTPKQVSVPVVAPTPAVVVQPEIAQAPAPTPTPEVSVPQAATGVSLTGTITDYNTGLALPKVNVALYAKPTTNVNPPEVGEPIAEIITSSKGEFVFPAVNTGLYLLRGWSDTHQTFDDEGILYEEVVVVEGVTPEPRTFTVFAGNTLEGIITDEATGKPLSGVKLTAKYEKKPVDGKSTKPSSAISNQEGFFRFEHYFGSISYSITQPIQNIFEGHKPYRDLQLRIEYPGFTEGGIVDNFKSIHENRLSRDQQIYPLNIRMRPTVQYHFTIVDEHGNQIPSAEARIYQGPPGFSSYSFDYQASKNGDFTFEVPSNAKMTFAIQAAGYEDLTTPFIQTTSIPLPSDIYVLQKSEFLQLTIGVFDEDRNPLQATVEIINGVFFGDRNSHHITVGSDQTDATTGLYVHTFEKGKIFEAGTVYVEVKKDGYKKSEKQTVTLEQARRNELIEFQLLPETEKKTFWASGQIMGPDGLPLAGAVISSMGFEGPNQVSTVTDLHGRYLLEGISVGNTELEIRHADYGKAYLRNLERNGSYNNLVWHTVNSVVEIIAINQLTKEPIANAMYSFEEEQLQQIVEDQEQQNVFFLEGSSHGRVRLTVIAEGYPKAIHRHCG